MAITVVGSVAFDTVETPAGRRERCLAGAATYFSLSASFFTDVRVIAVVGEDFGAAEQAVFDARKIDTAAFEHAARQELLLGGLLSRKPERSQDAQHGTECFGSFRTEDPRAYSDSQFLFLANIDPVLQRRVRDAMPDAQARWRRHHELLDQGPQARASGSAQGPRRTADQRHRNAHADWQPQLSLGGWKDLLDGSEDRS